MLRCGATCRLTIEVGLARVRSNSRLRSWPPVCHSRTLRCNALQHGALCCNAVHRDAAHHERSHTPMHARADTRPHTPTSTGPASHTITREHARVRARTHSRIAPRTRAASERCCRRARAPCACASHTRPHAGRPRRQGRPATGRSPAIYGASSRYCRSSPGTAGTHRVWRVCDALTWHRRGMRNTVQ